MSLDRLVTRATLTPGPELELEAGDRRPHPGADQAGLDAVGGQGPHQLHPAASVCFWSCSIFLEPCRSDMGGSVQPPGRCATAGTGPPAARVGLDLGLRLGPGRRGQRDVDVGRRRARAGGPASATGRGDSRRGRLPGFVGGVVGTGDERLAPPERPGRARPAADAPVRRPRKTEASGMPVAIRTATKMTATRNTAAPAVPSPACRGRPTSTPRQPPPRAQRVGAENVGRMANSARPQTPSSPSTMPTPRRQGSALSTWSGSSGSLRSIAARRRRRPRSRGAGRAPSRPRARDRSRPRGRPGRAGRPTGPGPAGRRG